MGDNTNIVRDYFDANVQGEWNRIAGRPESLLTCRKLERYIKPGDKVLDIGGEPGRYSPYLAEKGCDVIKRCVCSGRKAFYRPARKTSCRGRRL